MFYFAKFLSLKFPEIFSSAKNLKHFIFIFIYNCASNKDKRFSTPHAAFKGHFLARKPRAGIGLVRVHG
jgi:hypothetical protein